MLEAILLILTGIIAAPSLLLAKKPDAKDLLDKITPYQGWIGVIFFIWGVWGIISQILHIGYLAHFPIIWILVTAVAVVEAALGFILGFNLINTYVLSKNPKTEEKGQQLLAKLLPLQGRLGLAAIILGIIVVVLLIIL